MAKALQMWVIYDHPRDEPNHFVARRWDIQAGKALPTKVHLLSKDLNALRSALPPGLCKMERDDRDDPVIMETWI